MREKALGMSEEAMAESVANVRRLLEEVGVSTDDLLDAVIEEYLIIAHRIHTGPHSDEEREIYGFAVDEPTKDEKQAALG